MLQTLVVPDPLADLARLEGVPSAVAAARAAVDVLLRDRGLRSIPAESSVAALLEGARASAALSGDPDRMLPGAVRLSTELLELSRSLRTTPGQVLARMHALVVGGSEAAGRLRGDPGVSERVAGLGALLSGSTTAPAMVLAAVAHAEVASIRPFGDGDGVVARAVEHMVLVATGVDPLGVVVVEAGHRRRAAAYEARLRGYAEGSLHGVRAWILHCLDAVTDGAELSPARRPAP